jgi:hypothetical protein
MPVDYELAIRLTFRQLDEKLRKMPAMWSGHSKFPFWLVLVAVRYWQRSIAIARASSIMPWF